MLGGDGDTGGRHIAARTSVLNLVVIARQPEIGERSAEATTNPFMRPAFTWLPVGSTTSQIIGTWPASTSRIASAEPL